MWLTRFKTSLYLLCGCALLAGCEVVDLDADGKPIIPMSKEEAAAIRNMQPKDIADKLWANIVQDAKANTVNLADFSTKTQNDKSYFVQFTGKVERLDGQSGAINVVIKTPEQEIPVQIGTIIRGNAIRDASSLISFDQFKNQIQFARLSKEFNRKAMSGITKPDESWIGQDVDVFAAVTVKNGQIQDAVPIEISKR